MNKQKKGEQHVKKWICLSGLLYEFTQLNKKSVPHLTLKMFSKAIFNGLLI